MGQVVGDGGYGGGSHQDQQHGVPQLLQKPLEQGGLRGLPQAVGAVFRQTALRLGGGQALRSAFQVRQNLIGGLGIFLVHTITPLNDSAHPGK